GRHPRVGFTVTAGRGSPAFTQLKVTVPTEMKLVSGHGVSLKARGVRHPGFGTRLSHGVLQISLHRALSQVAVTIGRPALRIAKGRQPRVRHRTVPKLS